MKSTMLGAMALLTLIGALFVMQSTESNTPTADAATGSIQALNVGTCLATDAAAFKDEDDECKLFNDESGTDNDWEVRDKIVEVSTLYATYAHDPKTASDEPRAILEDSDLLKISITDLGRDKRTGVLIRGASGPVSIGNDDTAGTLGKVIRDNLTKETPDLHFNADASDNIVYSSHEDGNDGITLYRGGDNGGTLGKSIISSSGTFTLNFARSGTDSNNNNAPFKFSPGDFDVEGGAIVRFYGCEVNDTPLPSPTSCTAGTSMLLGDDRLEVDEDRSNGEASSDTAPWLVVRASVPDGKDFVIEAIYYQTSEAEELNGDERYHNCEKNGSNTRVYEGDNNIWRCDNPSTSQLEIDFAKERGTDRVYYTDDERSDNRELLVRASSDGDVRSVNLKLKETELFSGVYEGYLRLTDSNGDGSATTDNSATTDIDETARMDWGLDVLGRTPNHEKANPPRLGVESGPVTIEYRDSDGSRQTLRIEIDNRPPTIAVENPANGTSSDDQSPDFSGTLEDAESGLVDKSFRLVVDNVIDGSDGKNDDYVLDGRGPDAKGVEGTGTDGNGKVTHVGQYSGYSDDAATFGIVKAGNLYKLGDDSCDNANNCYIEAERHDDGANRGRFDDNVRLDLQDTKGDNSRDVDTRDKEFEVDFQAFVLDMAGNIGFSDADPVNPRFINALGEDKNTDRGPENKGKQHNILGYYSAHIITLDEKDPVIDTERSVTGFYGRVNDKNVADRFGIMVVFDGPIAASSVSTNTFWVRLDDGSTAEIVDVDVESKYVFLKLASELASDATPILDIANDEKVEDMAGNETFGKEVSEFELKDGISPRLTVTLNGGSGSGTGQEGPEQLTKDKMTVHVSSDEALQSAPRIIVVCESLRWNQDADEMEEENEVDSRHDINDFIAKLSGSLSGKPKYLDYPVTTKPRTSNTKAAGDTYKYTCGYDEDDDNFSDEIGLQGLEVSSISRPGENWEYTWQNQAGNRMLKDGVLTAIAFARDRSRYAGSDGDVENWGSASAEFTLDTELKSPLTSAGGDLQPNDGDTIKEERPFILIEFNESTTVTLESVELDDVEIKQDFEEPQDNRFIYWPVSISQDDHEVEVVASDAAGNEVSFEYDFAVEARGDFVINLLAGWNAVSVPADPVDTAIQAVFTDAAIKTVIGWDTQGWRIAVRRDGVWESNQMFGALNDIRAKYGYWVKSDNFVRQPLALRGPVSRGASGSPIPIGIDTVDRWNFVGVIDQDGDQTEGDDFGTTLQDSQNNPITASEYLGSKYVRAYTWNATFSRFDVLRPSDPMTIGDGVWVYYEGGIAP